MDDLVERFKRLQKQEQEHKEELARLSGKRDQLMAQLKEDFGISTLEEAEAKLQAMKKGISRREARCEKLIGQIEGALNG